MTSGTRSSCTIRSPRWVWPSKPMWSTATRRSRAGSTGQPGRQLAPSSAAVTGSTVASAGAGGALADDDVAAHGDGAEDGDGVVAGVGGAAVHCTSTTPAASISASTAPRRSKHLNWDVSSPRTSVPHKTAAISGFARQVRRQRYRNVAGTLSDRQRRLSALIDGHWPARRHGPGGPSGGSGREDVPGAVVLPRALGPT